MLLADYLDVSLMQNRTALTLANIFDNMYSNKVVEHVELYFNGDYRGVYLLTEQIDEKKGRLGLDEYEEEDYAPGRDEYQFLAETGFDIVDDPTIDIEDVFMIDSFVPVPDVRPDGNPAEIKYPETKDGRPADAAEYKMHFKPAAMNNLARWYPDMDKELYHYRYDGLVGFISEHSAHLQMLFQKPYNEFCRLFDAEPIPPTP